MSNAAYLDENPDKKARHRQLSRDLMRKKRSDPEYRVAENARRQLLLARKEERDGRDTIQEL